MDLATVEHDASHLDLLARSTMRAVGRFLTKGGSETGNWRVEYELRDGEITRVFTHHGRLLQSRDRFFCE